MRIEGDIHANVERRLLDLKPQTIINVTVAALELKEQYANRSHNHCLVEAMGGTVEDMDDGGYRYQLPDIMKVEGLMG